jgi:TRAP-type C4-dicarboxylate transport system permease small subunit
VIFTRQAKDGGVILRLLKNVAVIYHYIIDSLAALGGFLIIGAMVIISFSVVMRYILESPPVWVLETTEYILVWFTFLAAAWILKKEGHVKVEILVSRINPRVRVLFGIITSIIGVALCSLLIVYGSQVVWDFSQRNLLMDSLLMPPKAPLIAIIPIGSFLLLLQFLVRTYSYLESWKVLSGKVIRDLETT